MEIIENRTFYYLKDLLPKQILETLEPRILMLGDLDYNVDNDGEIYENCVFILTTKTISIDILKDKNIKKSYNKDNINFIIYQLPIETVNIDFIIKGKYSKAFAKNFNHPCSYAKLVINKSSRLLEILRNAIYDNNDKDREIYLNENIEYDSIPKEYDETYEKYSQTYDPIK
jgi:hypothetical protein